MPNPITPNWRTEAPALALLALVGLAAVYFWSHFPDRVPSHWNFAGEVDAYSGKNAVALLMPTLMAGFYLLFLALPYLDPKKEKYAQFLRTYHVFKFSILIYFAYIYLVTGLSALGYPVRVDRAVSVGVGALFLILGNYMGKLKHNWFIGIRTPWTMSSEAVWNRTHRAGGKAFMLGGLIIAALPWLPRGWQLFGLLAVVIVLVAGTFAYSYILFRREKNSTK